jgi:hypothetical protein
MELNGYALEVLARDRLTELRTDAELRESLRETPATPVRVVLGLALIRVGSWTLGRAHRSLALRLF